MLPIHDPQTNLLLLQCGCFSTTLTLALILLLSRWLQPRTTGLSYETSRWLLIAALLIFALHYLLQMIFGFRAQGDEEGALINILFYMPASFLIDCAILRISTGQRYMKRFVAVGIGCIAVALVLFAVGWIMYRSLHMGWVLHAMGAVFVVQMLIFIFYPGSELRRIESRIEEETAADITDFRLHMRAGTVLLYAMGLIGALSIYHTTVLLFVAGLFLLSLIFYVTCFIALGFSILSVSNLVDEEVKSPDEAPADEAPLRLTPEQKAQIETGLSHWRAEHGYTSQNLNIASMAQLLGVSKRVFAYYLAKVEGVTFRVWLSNIRIEEAKRLLLDDVAYSNEAIAEACGFSSRSWMQEKFRASTGMTPTEWRDAARRMAPKDSK